MERNKINFITGETYTLAELFSENRRIVIPDLQRDYCWGDETNKKSSGGGELVTAFIENLIEQYKDKQQDSLNLGLFYGYEVPANHIQLCDGQQRLTTLYLLLGMLNKKTGKFRQNLISDEEYNHDDKEPYLNYSIRESSLYFLSDLVCKFFIPNEDSVKSVKEIKEADWYFNDYNLDPSICSMINALQIIETLLDDNQLDLVSFGDWLLHKLTFLYFDMENRENGEETFVIINTTGEPLSATQNLKPLVIDANTKKVKKEDKEKEISRQWEEIETWFWKNRQGDNDTADAGFAEFLRWISIIEQKDKPLPHSEKSEEKYLIQQILRDEEKCKFPYDDIHFDKIYNYWNAIKWIMEDNKCFSFKKTILSPPANAKGRKIIEQRDCFVLLPVLSFVYKYQDSIRDDENMQRNAKRIYEFFENLRRTGNVSGNVNSLVRETLRIIDILPEDKREDKRGDIISILGSSENVSKQILTGEEKCKLEILSENNSQRNVIEEAFWDIQRHEVWKGEIMPIIECSFNENREFDINRFKKSEKIFHLLFCSQSSNGEISYKKDPKDDVIYLLRRCAILCSESYEPIKRGSYTTFGWTWNDWHEILCTPNSQHSRMKYLFNYLLKQTEEENIEDIKLCKLKKILENFILKSTTKNDYVEFAKDDYLLSFTKNSDVKNGYLLSFTKNSDACDMYWGDNDWQICISGGIGRHTSFFSKRNAYILKAFGGSSETGEDKKLRLNIEKIENWCIWYRSNCVVLQCDEPGIKLDVRFLSNDTNGGTLEIKLTTTDDKNISDRYPKVMDSLQNFDTKEDYVVTKEFKNFDDDFFGIKGLIEETIKMVNKSFEGLSQDSPN